MSPAPSHHPSPKQRVRKSESLARSRGFLQGQRQRKGLCNRPPVPQRTGKEVGALSMPAKALL